MKGARVVRLVLRMTSTLLFVAVTMAISCPEPTPPEPVGPIGPAPETKSAERTAFEASYVEGLYSDGVCIFAYDQSTCQKSVSPSRHTCRIQSDDQKYYVHVLFVDKQPNATGDVVTSNIIYRLAEGEETTMIIRYTVVKANESYLWLWNEFQKSGIIISRF